MATRREQRNGFPPVIRHQLAEDDLDRHDKRLDYQDEKHEGQQKLLVGAMISFSLAALGIAVKVVIDTAGK